MTKNLVTASNKTHLFKQYCEMNQCVNNSQTVDF